MLDLLTRYQLDALFPNPPPRPAADTWTTCRECGDTVQLTSPYLNACATCGKEYTGQGYPINGQETTP